MWVKATVASERKREDKQFRAKRDKKWRATKPASTF